MQDQYHINTIATREEEKTRDHLKPPGAQTDEEEDDDLPDRGNSPHPGVKKKVNFKSRGGGRGGYSNGRGGRNNGSYRDNTSYKDRRPNSPGGNRNNDRTRSPRHTPSRRRRRL